MMVPFFGSPFSQNWRSSSGVLRRDPITFAQFSKQLVVLFLGPSAFPNIGGVLFWGPYMTDPMIVCQFSKSWESFCGVLR